MMLNPTIKLALNEWSNSKTAPSTPSTLRDFSDITFGMQNAILKKAFKKLLSELPTKSNPTDFLIIGACGFVGEENSDYPFIVVGDLAPFKGFVNKKIKEKNCAKGIIYVENGNTICFSFEKGKIKNESKAKKVLKPIKSLLNKFDTKFLFSQELESKNVKGENSSEGNNEDKNENNNANLSLSIENIQFIYTEKVPKISPSAEAILKDILAKAGEDNIVITATLRSVVEQTKIVVKSIVEQGAAAVAQQYNGHGKALVKAFINAKQEGKDTKGILTAVANAINTIGAAKISEHCNISNPAIAILPASIKNPQNFEAILLTDNRVSAICPPQDSSYRIIIL